MFGTIYHGAEFAPFDSAQDERSAEPYDNGNPSNSLKPCSSLGKPEKTLFLRVFVVPFFSEPLATPAIEAVAKNTKALNHEGHEGHKGKEKFFFVTFVVPFFSGIFATVSIARMTAGWFDLL